jgi:pyruvate carboxylase
MPGGQFTNLKEQANAMGLGKRWPEIARTYAQVNQLFGDIVKVTPSSKVVGDMTMFLVSRGIKASDVLNLPPGETPFPESVIDMLSGGLGQPPGGFPEDIVKVVLGDRKTTTKRPGEDLPPLDLDAYKKELAEKLGREVSDDDLFSSLMYPQVFEEYAAFKKDYGAVSALPTPAYFYGLLPGEEISIDIEAGKRLIVRLINVGEPDAQGQRAVNFELNGVARQAVVTDKKIKPQGEARRKADPAKPDEIAAPIPGLVASIAVSVGKKVSKGDKLLTLEAMKMYTTINAPEDGVVEELFVAVGDTVESKDLMLRLRS